MICAGDLQDRITIQQKSVIRAANGDEIVTYTNVVANLRAQVLPIRGREFVSLRAAQSWLSLKVLIRYRSGINSAMRLLWQTNPYEIVEVIPGGVRNRTELTLMCQGEDADSA